MPLPLNVISSLSHPSHVSPTSLHQHPPTWVDCCVASHISGDGSILSC
jgi:hypothetical protein